MVESKRDRDRRTMVQVAFKLGQLGKISRNGDGEGGEGVMGVNEMVVRPGGENSFLNEKTMGVNT